MNAAVQQRVDFASIPGVGDLREGVLVSIVPLGKVYRVRYLFDGQVGSRLLARLEEVDGGLQINYPADRLVVVKPPRSAASWMLFGRGLWILGALLFLIACAWAALSR